MGRVDAGIEKLQNENWNRIVPFPYILSDCIMYYFAELMLVVCYVKTNGIKPRMGLSTEIEPEHPVNPPWEYLISILSFLRSLNPTFCTVFKATGYRNPFTF
jgi:hypothetical protein